MSEQQEQGSASPSTLMALPLALKDSDVYVNSRSTDPYVNSSDPYVHSRSSDPHVNTP